MSGYPYGTTEQEIVRLETRKECEQKGIHWARGHITLANLGVRRQHISEWINEVEHQQRLEMEAEHRRIAQEAAEAAKLSAEVSRDAAIASKQSARWTMVAALAAAVGTVATAISTAISAAQAMHWLR